MSLTLDEILAHLDAGNDPNRVDARGRSLLSQTILSSAKAADKQRLVKKLLKLGADPNSRDEDGNSPLDHAVFACALPLIKLLAGVGDGPDSRDAQGRTALMKINQTDSKVYKVVTLLVSLGADVDARCERGRTPMMYAALVADHLGMACFALQSAKARVDLTDNDGATVIELCEKGNRSMLRMLHRNLAEQTGAANRMPDPGTPDAEGFLPPG